MALSLFYFFGVVFSLSCSFLLQFRGKKTSKEGKKFSWLQRLGFKGEDIASLSGLGAATCKVLCRRGEHQGESLGPF